MIVSSNSSNIEQSGRAQAYGQNETQVELQQAGGLTTALCPVKQTAQVRRLGHTQMWRFVANSTLS